MTVKDLKRILDKISDDAIIVAGSSDHSYRSVYAGLTKGIQYSNGEISEYYETIEGKTVEILVID